uniref:(northern house mosquito) hypothetical protein n=1 Tax=Culex pipiens TaxID=7175 RepID=A0A8D8KKB2_CULPI
MLLFSVSRAGDRPVVPWPFRRMRMKLKIVIFWYMPQRTDLDGVVSPIEGRCSWHPDPDLDRSDALRARGKPLRHVHLIRHCRCYHPSPLPASIRIELTVVCCQGFDLHA